ncbi:MAG: Sensor protein FixL [Syntrophorhabdus sp. PtaU1.Bin050]|nr:MAG: Sensor protein FixL [Syntrophorhabdus sp. PtaU1.Bin050]
MQRSGKKRTPGKLGEKNEELDQFFNVSLDFLCIVNTDGYFIRLSPSFEKVLGYTGEELTAQPFLEFVHPEDRDATREAMATLGRQKKMFNFTNRYRCKDGTYRWFEWRAAVSGNMIYGAARDVTERKIAEEFLRERLAFEQLFSDISAGMTKVALDRIDQEIVGALQRLLELFHVDRCCLLRVSPEHTSWRITHLADAEGLPPLPVNTDLSLALVPYGYRKVVEEHNVWAFASLDDLPPEADADRRTLEKWGIRSAINIPVAVGGSAEYAIAVTANRETHAWSQDHIPRLRMLGEVFVNVLQRRQIRAELEERVQFERLLSEFSGRFVNIPPEQVDREINEAFRMICEHCGFEVATLWQRSDSEPNMVTLTHLYRPLGGPPLPEHVDARDTWPWCLRELRSGRIVAVSTEEAPADAARDQEMWRYYSIKSSLTFPLSIGEGQFVGALGFNTVTEKRSWSDEFVKRLQLLSQVFANALARKQSEAAATEAQSRIAALVESTDDMIWSVDPERFGFLTFNSALRNYFLRGMGLEITLGMRPEEMVGGSFIPLVAERWRQLYLRALREGPFTEEWVTSAGTSVLLLSLNLLKRSGQVFGISVFGKDITERKAIDEKIRKAAREWQGTFDAIPDLVMILDRECRIVRINAAAKSYFGLPVEEVIGADCSMLMHINENPVLFYPFLKTMESRGHEESESYDETRNSWFRISADPIIDDDGEIRRIICSLKDITEQKMAESEVFAARKELWRTDRLLRMGELTASLAHELNQPLTSILSNARAAIRFIRSDRIDMNELVEILEDITKDDKRAGDIIRSLRSMLRPEEGEQELINVNALLGETVALFNSEAIIRNIKIETRLAELPLSVEANRVQLQQVVINLLMNAAESMTNEHRPKKIIVETRTTNGNRVQVAVRDFGTGIDEQVRSRIFDPFFTTKRSGLGMGLSLARTIIEAQNGHIRAENNPDGGMTFYFELPGVEE